MRIDLVEAAIACVLAFAVMAVGAVATTAATTPIVTDVVAEVDASPDPEEGLLPEFGQLKRERDSVVNQQQQISDILTELEVEVGD